MMPNKGAEQVSDITMHAEQRKPATVSRVLGRSPLSGRRTRASCAGLGNRVKSNPKTGKSQFRKESEICTMKAMQELQEVKLV